MQFRPLQNDVKSLPEIIVLGFCKITELNANLTDCLRRTFRRFDSSQPSDCSWLVRAQAHDKTGGRERSLNMT